MDLFQVQVRSEETCKHQGGLYTALNKYLEITRGPKYAHNQADQINYVSVIKKALAMGNIKNYLDQEHSYLQGLHMSILKE